MRFVPMLGYSLPTLDQWFDDPDLVSYQLFFDWPLWTKEVLSVLFHEYLSDDRFSCPA
jgi:hypothetical protein